MLDMKWIRDNPDQLDDGLEKRGADPVAKQLIALDDKRREHIALVQDWQEERNKLSKEIGIAKSKGDETRAAKLMEQVSRVSSDVIDAGAKVSKKLEAELAGALAVVPNMPLDDVPVGPDESANREERRVGEKPSLNDAQEHFEIGEALGLMDFETAAKLSGSRFVVLKGGLARLERALGQFMLDLHTNEHGYAEVQPPLLVRSEVLFGTGQLPKFAEDQFPATSRPLLNEEFIENVVEFRKTTETSREDIIAYLMGELAPERKFEMDCLVEEFFKDQIPLWLIPTAEVPLTNLVREQIVEASELPMRVTALTPCFRSEAGSAGKDTRGMLRQHQFNKVELVSITTPEKSIEEHERMTACAEEVLKRLGLHYRVMTLSTGDMGFGARKTYDLEVWLPGQGAYREISSCSLCGDFQARRMNARYRPDGEKATRFVHTLNGSGVATGRALIAVMENYQNGDGSIAVPDVLQPYMGGTTRIG